MTSLYVGIHPLEPVTLEYVPCCHTIAEHNRGNITVALMYH
jgi:hypothetical protein